jgi:hypothetical protein
LSVTSTIGRISPVALSMTACKQRLTGQRLGHDEGQLDRGHGVVLVRGGGDVPTELAS